MKIRTLLSSGAATIALLSGSTFLYAATGDVVTENPEPAPVVTATGTVATLHLTVENQSAPNVTNRWTLLRPGNKKLESSERIFDLTGMEAGVYTILAEPPESASTKIDIKINGTLSQSVERPQATFTINGTENVDLKVVYTYTNVGVVTVDTEPKGIDFRLTGPNNSEWKGKTPFSIEKAPAGLYAAYFTPGNGCPTPKPISDKLNKNSRIALTMDIRCDKLQHLIDQEKENEEKSLQFVTVQINGQTVVFEDVPLGMWFSEPIYNALNTKMVSGDKDADGKLLGRFRPDGMVAISELVKMAHTIANIDVSGLTDKKPVNPLVGTGAWFTPYFVSAESLDWHVFRDTMIDPNRPARRSEVIATLLQALDVPKVWAKGKTFADVPSRIPHADAIETAAQAGLIKWNKDSPILENFRPDDPLNRAELAQIITKAIELYIKDTPRQFNNGQSY